MRFTVTRAAPFRGTTRLVGIDAEDPRSQPRPRSYVLRAAFGCGGRDEVGWVLDPHVLVETVDALADSLDDLDLGKAAGMNPTCENLAAWCYGLLARRAGQLNEGLDDLSQGVYVAWVEVEEQGPVGYAARIEPTPSQPLTRPQG